MKSHLIAPELQKSQHYILFLKMKMKARKINASMNVFQVCSAAQNPEVHVHPKKQEFRAWSAFQVSRQSWKALTNLSPNTLRVLILPFFFGFLTADVTQCCRDLGNKMHH